MPRSFLVKKTNNYSHCPLKKRPVQLVKDDCPEEVQEKAMSVDNSEPENLSTKPEDLSLTAPHLYPRKTHTPSVGFSVVPVKAERHDAASAASAAASPRLTSSSALLHNPLLAPPHYLSKTGGPLEPLNLNTPVDSHHHYTTPSSWHRPTPSHYPASHFLAAFNYAYPPAAAELYHHHHQYSSSLYPVSPIRGSPIHPQPHHHEQLSPYAPRDSTHSPPHHSSMLASPLRAPVAVVASLPHRHLHPADTPKLYMPYQDHCGLSPTSSIASSSSHGVFPSISPPPATPEDLSSPGSVSSGSSAGSVGVGKKRKDTSAPRYQCPDCAKSYSTYSGLSKHQQFHCAATAGNQAKKSFSCKYCEKVYVSLGALKMHIRTHTLPCKCKLCGKAFSRPWLLQGHIRTHTGEKPFTCQLCNRAFADRSNLRAHLQTHSDVKKYSCTACNKTFSRMSLLTKHMDGGCSGADSPTHDADVAAAAMHMGDRHLLIIPKREDSGDEGHALYP